MWRCAGAAIARQEIKEGELRTIRQARGVARRNEHIRFREELGCVKSAAPCLRKGATLGVGAGQMSRVDSVKLAVMKAQEFVAGEQCGGLRCIFSIPGLNVEAIKAGATAVIQPGGSGCAMPDVIAAAG